MSTSVGFIGWNSAQRAWNTSTWNTSPAFALTATASVNSTAVGVTGDANVSVTGVAGTSAVGSVTVVGLANVSVTGVAGTSAIGTISTTRGDKAFVTGVAGTSAVGNVFTTIVGFSVTASVNSATVDSSGEANIEVTGVSATGLVTAITDFPVVWGQVLPSQTPNFSAISPSQTPSWIDVAA